jgi:hypothetical protein
MTYNLLLTAEEIPSRVTYVLSEAFGIRPADVDVAAEGDYGARNWDAVVSCEYEELRGDLTWSLSIYATDDGATRPTEERLALLLSRELGTVTLFPQGMTIPSVWELASDGTYDKLFPENLGQAGAHDLSPHYREGHFNHWKRRFGIEPPAVMLAGDLSNIDDVVRSMVQQLRSNGVELR